MSLSKLSFTRYAKAHRIIASDPLLRRTLIGPLIAVCRPNQTSLDVPSEVVYVVKEIHRQNKDVAAMCRADIEKIAFALLVESAYRPPLPLIEPATLPSKPKPKLMTHLTQSLADELRERRTAILKTRDASIQKLTETRDAAQKALDDCDRALKALEPAPEPPKPVYTLKTADDVAAFEQFVLDLFRTNPATKLTMQQVRSSYNRPLTHSACWNRLNRMAKRGDIRFVNALVSNNPQKAASSKP